LELQEKLSMLQASIRRLGSLAVAFSGGVDSTFLAKVAHDLLQDRMIAVTARSSTYPEREFKEAADYVRQAGIRQFVIISEELDIDGFADNPANRCYFCKKELFNKIWEVAKQNKINFVADGSNLDDLNDYRPGMQATKELGVVSPLREAGLTKDEIRSLSRSMGLPTWDKPAFACLASRIPYGQTITKAKLAMVEQAEQYLLELGFRQVRVRHHGDLARIEVAATELERFYSRPLMLQVAERLQQIGFVYVSLDLKGYRTGSMNEVMSNEQLPSE
jgi:uncharacterized protein